MRPAWSRNLPKIPRIGRPIALIPALLMLLLSALAQAKEEAVITLGPPIPQAPGRIVSLAPNITEIVFRLGAGDRLVGVTRYCEDPPEAKRLPRVGGFLDPSLEAILALRPNLVIAVPNSSLKGPLDRLATMGIPILVVRVDTFDRIYNAVDVLGSVLGRDQAAREIVGSMRARLEAVQAKVAGLKRPRVLFVYGHRPLVVAGPGSFADALISMAGGENVAGGSPIPYPTYTVEHLIAAAPDVIVDAYMAEEEGSAARMFETWSSIPAVRSGRVVRFPSTRLLRPGPSLADGLEELLRILHGG